MYVDILYDILYITSEIKQAYDDYSKGRGGGAAVFLTGTIHPCAFDST